MAHSEETLKQKPTLADVIKELAKINKRLDAHGAQFKAIRDGIEHNSVISERMWATFTTYALIFGKCWQR